MNKRLTQVIMIFWLIPFCNCCQDPKPISSGDIDRNIDPGAAAELRTVESAAHTGDHIVFLEEIARIDDSLVGSEDYFENITSICLDTRNNLYIADSGVHKIFCFNDRGAYEGFIGGPGQAPGKFLGNLRISAGRDGRLYVTDDQNLRLDVYTLNGELIKQFRLDPFLHDTPAANSKGEIFLLSLSGLNLVDFYDPDMKLLATLLDIEDPIESWVKPR